MEPIRVEQGGVARYRFKLVDQDQNPVPLGSLTQLQVTIYDQASDTDILAATDIRNVNGGTYHAVTGKGTFQLTSAHNAIVNVDDPATPIGEEETHVMLFEALWGGGGAKRWEVLVYVKNLHRV